MAKHTIGYKAFRIDQQGQLRYLFHTHNKTSVVPLDIWLTAKRNWVTDGSRQKKYRSAFHFLRTKQDIARFQKLTKNKYVVIPVQVRDIEPKPRTSVGSWLAREIRISSRTAKRVLKCV